MRRMILSILGILGILRLEAQILDTIIYNGDSDEHINIVILGDAYTAANHAANKLKTDATSFVNAMLAESPFLEYANFYNFFIIKRNSTDELADHPENAADENLEIPACPMNTSNTRYNTSFDLFSFHRLLGPDVTGETQAFIDLANYFPNYDQAVMLVNDPCYGGSGGQIAVSSVHIDADEIAIHELAHSYATLEDEYYVNDVSAAEKPNMTMNTNPGTVKWKDWIGINGIGIYQHTCPLRDSLQNVDPNLCYADNNYDEFDQWYKPHQNCKMQVLGSDFCAVCKEALIDRMYALTDPFEDKIPNLTSLFIFNGGNTTFGSNLILSNPSSYIIQWELNGNMVSNRNNSIEQWVFEDFASGVNVLKLIVIDATTLSKSYLPANGYQFELTWNVSKIDLCSKTIDKFNYANSFPSGSGANQPTSDDFNWSEWVGATPTANTGPSSAYDGSTYLYVEACCSNIPNKQAELQSPCFDLTDLNRPGFRIYYHMFGNDIGKLEIEVSVNAGLTFTNVFTIVGEQGDAWKPAYVDLSNYISPYTKIRIRATTGPGILGDIGIDMLEIVELCPDTYVLDENHTGTNTYKAQNSISSTSNVSSGSTTYQAGLSVNLNGGFNVNSGATFKTQNGGCN